MVYQKKLTRKPRKPVFSTKDIREWLKQNRKEIKLLKFEGRVSSGYSQFQCRKCGHIWETSVSSIKSGSGCPKCNKKKRYIPLAEVKAWFKKNLPSVEVEYYTGLISDNTNIFSCKKCGHIWSASIAYLKAQKSGCPKCREKTLWKERAKKWLAEKKPNIEVVEWGETKNDISVFKCKKCGYTFRRSYDSLLRTKASGCLNCNRTTVTTLDIVEQWLAKNKPNIEVVDYCGAGRYPSRFRCKKCGYEWDIAFQVLQKTQRDCPNCCKPRGGMCNEEIEKKIAEKGIEIIGHNPHKASNTKFRCKKCGRVWDSRPLIVARSKFGCFNCKSVQRRYTKEQIEKYLKKKMPYIMLVKYGGKTMAPSTFKCKKCGTEWESSMFSVKQCKYACPNWREHKMEKNV